MSMTPPPPPPPQRSDPNGIGGGSPMQNGPGTTAFVTGLVSIPLFLLFLLLPLLFAPLIIALSITAIVQGRKGERLAAQGLSSNRELATWGKILGLISLALVILASLLGLSLALVGVVTGG